MLNELDDRLSTIKRWSILRTIRTQSVAEHCFNVERICMRIAPILDISNVDELFRLSQAALHHDDPESIIGDIPATGKEHVTIKLIDVSGAAWYHGASDKIRAIVKLADLMEMFHFLALEAHMGNRYVRVHASKMKLAIVSHIAKYPKWPKDLAYNVNAWMAVVEIQVSERFGENGRGIAGSSKEST